MKIQKQKTNVTATEIGSSMNNVRIQNMKEIETLNKNVRQHSKEQLAKLRAIIKSECLPPIFVAEDKNELIILDPPYSISQRHEG